MQQWKIEAKTPNLEERFLPHTLCGVAGSIEKQNKWLIRLTKIICFSWNMVQIPKGW
jgi:hypothetical protein